MSQARRFLTAEWRYLVMLNYQIEPDLLRPFLPQGTELDSWQGQTFVSIVGFNFLNTRLLGLPIPGHINFEELNLRFYVRRKGPEGCLVGPLPPRRGWCTTKITSRCQCGMRLEAVREKRPFPTSGVGKRRGIRYK